jgi:hypothetical protein
MLGDLRRFAVQEMSERTRSPAVLPVLYLAWRASLPGGRWPIRTWDKNYA